jgi:hypothetical protein
VKRERALERRLGVVVIGWALLLAANDSLPYLGLRDDSCQTMFCGLEWGERWNSHFFLPQHAMSDVWAYLDVTDVEIAPEPQDARLASVARWLRLPERDRNTEAVRVAVSQLCAGGHHVALSTRRTDGEHAVVRVSDACSEPSLSAPHSWVPIRLYETDIPRRPPHR